MNLAFRRRSSNSPRCPKPQFSANACLSRYTRFGIGGPADLFAETRDTDRFIDAWRIARASGLETVVIGGGTNLIVSDAGFRGVVLKLSNQSHPRRRPDASMSRAARRYRRWSISRSDAGLKGLETMTGIPGSAGAAVYGNAGAYGHSIAERISRVRFFDGARRSRIR